MFGGLKNAAPKAPSRLPNSSISQGSKIPINKGGSYKLPASGDNVGNMLRGVTEAGPGISSDNLGNMLKGTGNPKGYNPVEFNGTVKVNGEVRDVSRRVYQRGDIDINYYDKDSGLTNLQLMKKGRASIGSDGKFIQLHHLTQQESGAMVEILETTHQKYTNQLHGLV